MQCSKCGRRYLHDPDSEPGEFRICKNCHHIMAFTDDHRLRELTPSEQDEARRFRYAVVPFHPLTIVLSLVLAAALIHFMRPLL